MKFLNLLFFLTALFSTNFTYAEQTLNNGEQSQTVSQLSAYDIRVIKDYVGMGYSGNSLWSSILEPGEIPGLQGIMFAGITSRGDWDLSPLITYQQLVHLNRALDKIPNYTNVVYRGVYSNDANSSQQRFPLGRVWKERRFTSTTNDLKVATAFAMGAEKNAGCGGCNPDIEKPKIRFSTLIEIKSLTGKDIRSQNEEEKEILFKTNVIFKVTRSQRNQNGRYEVRLEELNPAQMSDADKAALAHSEADRIRRVVAENFENDEQKLNEQITFWNQLNQTIREQNLLDQQIDFDAQEGGD